MRKNGYLIAIIIIIMMGVSSSPLAQEQRNRAKDLFGKVPAQHRFQLLKMLKLYVQYERQRAYGRLYDMFSDETKRPKSLRGLHVLTSMDSKVSYIKHRQNSYPKVLNFIPESIEDSQIAAYEIRGEATLRYKYGIIKRPRLLYVWLQNGQWYFSDLNEEFIEQVIDEPVNPSQ